MVSFNTTLTDMIIWGGFDKKVERTLERKFRKYCARCGLIGFSVYQAGDYFIRPAKKTKRQYAILKAQLPGIRKEIAKTLCAAGFSWREIPEIEIVR